MFRGVTKGEVFGYECACGEQIGVVAATNGLVLHSIPCTNQKCLDKMRDRMMLFTTSKGDISYIAFRPRGTDVGSSSMSLLKREWVLNGGLLLKPWPNPGVGDMAPHVSVSPVWDADPFTFAVHEALDCLLPDLNTSGNRSRVCKRLRAHLQFMFD